MRKTMLAAAAVAALLSIGASADGAAAMTTATPTQLGVATANDGLVQKAAIVCGYWGCRHVWWGPPRYYGYYGPGPYWGWHRPWWGWHRHWWWHHW
jgi:hypothetical protein